MPRKEILPSVMGLCVFGVLSCTSPKETDTTVGEFSECDPLDTGLCALPFPSSFFMKENPETATGWQLDFRPGTLPVNYNGVVPDPRYWNERDGFSPLNPIITFFANASVDGVVGHQNLESYLDADVKTIVFDLDTGERIPHFVELDMSHDQDDRRALVIRPVVPMGWGHHIVVGIRHITNTDDMEIAPSSAFLALRDAQKSDDYDVEGRRELYENVIFPALESEGFARSELQLAWDFRIASKESVTGKLRFMRDDMLERLPEGGPTYTITRVENFTAEENAHVVKRIYGKMTVPYYTEIAGKNTLLSRDEHNMPYYMGETERDFTVVVPRSLWEQGVAGPILQYGHGLMGSQGEVKSDYLGEMADRYGYVLIALDWSGMSAKDLDAVMLMIVNEIDRFSIVPERVQQGMVEFVAGLEMISGNLAQDPELTTVDADGNSVSVVDTQTKYFYGNSQGGILGLPYVTISPSIERGVLGVAGAPFSLLLPRSTNFESYFTLLQTMYPDYLEISLWLGMMQVVWDSGEPTGYMDSMHREPFDGVPKNILLQVGIGDTQVNTLGAGILMRGVGGGLVADPSRPVWGLEELPNGTVGSGLVEWDYGYEEPIISVPPVVEDNPHDRVRREFLGQEQLHHFLQTGELVNYCDGHCVGE